ncbi:cytochrome p450 [Rhyzopertha dominica]|nr:cytochrome p450 [Rhyzopertha dominica]
MFRRSVYKLLEIFETYYRIAQKRVPDILTRLEKKKLELIPECNNNSEQRFSSMLEMMIEMAINNPNSLSEADIIDHMMTFVATEKVFEELKEVVGEIPNAIDYSHLGKLKYMEMCIKEAMRLFAVGPFILRVTEEDFQIDKWKIPAGCTVIIGIYNVHRDPRHWERPEEFYPEHFLSDAVLNRHPYAYVPFSAGPRRCIGYYPFY